MQMNAELAGNAVREAQTDWSGRWALPAAVLAIAVATTGCAGEPANWTSVALAPAAELAPADLTAANSLVTGSIQAQDFSVARVEAAPSVPSAGPYTGGEQGGVGVGGRPKQIASERMARTGGYKIGKPYQINGQWYHPKHDPDYDQTGVASYYGGSFNGKATANGEVHDEGRLTAAHPTLPMPSLVYVTNLENGREILVRVNDRGPFVKGRIVDLSYRSAELLAIRGKGLARVRVRYAGPAPLDGNDQREAAFLRKQPWLAEARR